MLKHSVELHVIQFIFITVTTITIVSAYVSLERPKIIHAPQNASILANHQTFFICISDGNPKPKVTWMYNGKTQLPERYNIIRDSVLQLTSGRSEDNGAIISCVCRNVMGSEEKSAVIRVYNDINVVPKGFPKYFGKSSITVSQKNSNVTLECLVVGQPKLKIIWFKDYYPLDLRNNRFQLINSKNLFILKATESDTGKYQCMAVNEFGSMISPAKSLMIRVSRFSPHFVYVSPDQFIRTGASVTLRCLGEGSPTPHVYWICGNTKLSGHNIGSDKGQTEYVGSIEMILSDISESLNCTCVAKTNKETANHTVHITVKNLPVAPKIVRISDISPKSCLLTWKYQSSSTTPITSFSVFYIPSIFLRIEQPLSKVIDISSKEISGPDFEINTKITDLKPFTNYSLWLVTNGVEGVSEPSKIHSFKTLETKPTSAPRFISISLISETGVLIKWKPPIEANGDIVLYQIFHSKNKESPLNQWSINALKIRGNEERDPSVEIQMLERNTMYYFYINSRNSAGEGPFSVIIQKYINDDEIYQLKNLTLLSVRSRSADISWKIDSVSKVSLFKVICRLSSSSNLQNEKYGIFVSKINRQSMYFTTLSNLLPDTIYTVEIIPIIINIPKASTKIKFKTFITDDKISIKAISISQESIIISVTPELLLINPKIVIDYFPYAEANKSLSKTCFMQTENVCQIFNLTPETLYHLNIKYQGITNRIYYVETWAKAPDPIRDLHLEMISSNISPYIRATWKYKTVPLPIFEINYYPVNIPNKFKVNKFTKTQNTTDLKFETDPKTHGIFNSDGFDCGILGQSNRQSSNI